MKRLATALLLAVLPAAAAALATAPGQDDGALGGDFTLADHSGEPFSTDDLRGKVVMLSFGYTYCPDVCPLTLTLTARVLESLGERSEQVVPLFVSLDPKRDTPEVLADYVRFFHPAIVGLTGDIAQLKQVAERFNARFALHGDADGDRYTMDHTAHLFLLDTQGHVASIVPFGLPAEHIRQRVLRLLGDGDRTPTATGSRHTAK